MLAPLKEALYFIQHNQPAIRRIMLPYLILLMLADLASVVFTPAANLQMLVALLLYPYFMAKLIRFLHMTVTRGENGITPSSIQVPMALWSSLLLGYLVHGVASTLGLFLFFVPGVYIFIKLSFIDFNIVCHGSNVMDACKESFQQTYDNKIAILVGMLSIMVPTFLATVVVVQMTFAMGVPLLGFLIGNVLSVAMTVMTTVFLFRHFTLATTDYE
ncbi:YciC family protein [Pokkaliibacter sp. CJK22405]|uniref:YciC family protein n=1 Tax=Pokkaliibacter sp. CJK22405 TaxID=3384615 RepID=UPI003984EBB3